MRSDRSTTVRGHRRIIRSACLLCCFSLALAGCAQSPILLNDHQGGPKPGVRSFSQFFKDEGLEDKVREALHKDERLKAAYLQVNSYFGVVLLTGQVPIPDLKTLAAQKAQSVTGIHRLVNQVHVSPPMDWSQKFSDDILAKKVKSQLFFNSNTPSSRIKTVVSMQRVYLMGRVNRREAQHILRTAANIKGVKEVVNLFQYI